jgi:4-amino-4-deoxy-L-arabinose transferase-like glycosyltransferase
MSVSLLALNYILLFVLWRFQGSGWRASFLHATTAWAVLAILFMEGLSLIQHLSPAILAVAWAVSDLFLIGSIGYQLRQEEGPHRALWALPARVLDRADIGLLTGVSVIVTMVGLTALLNPPNTADVMTYHLPRVVHWLQQHSVTFYPTQESRQLQMAPGAEYLVFQLHALSGGDRLDNLIQWWSFVGSIVGVSLIAYEMGAGPRGQALSAVVCATIPQGILQASGAENDYVLAVWLVAFVWYLLRFSQTERIAALYGIGSAMGLACLTKPTALIFAPPLLIFLSLAWTKNTWKLFLKMLPTVLFPVAIINAGYWARNTQRYGTPLGPTNVRESKFTNDTISVGTVASNIVRNAALHLATPSMAANRIIEQCVIRIVHSFGAEENDPRTTWRGATFRVLPVTLDENFMGNPVHLGLLFVTLVIVIVSPSLRRSILLLYASGLVVAFVAFCAALRWQPYHTRLHLTLFVLWSAVIGTVLERKWRRWMTTSVGFVLLLLAVPAVVSNRSRPLLATAEGISVVGSARNSLYFRNRPALFQPYSEAAALVNATTCRTIALDVPPSSYEYPLLVLLNAEQGDKDVRYVDAFSVSAAEHSMCAVICVECTSERLALYEAEMGPATALRGWVSVFIKHARPSKPISP